MFNDDYFEGLGDNESNDENGDALEDEMMSQEEEAMLENRVLMDVSECQERDEICYITFYSEAQIIYPRDPENYCLTILTDMKEKEYAEYADANVTVIYPDNFDVKRGDNMMHNKPSDMAWFIQSRSLMTIQSLRDILDIQENVDFLKGLEGVMAASVFSEYEDRPKETYKIRQLIFDILRSRHYKIADDFIYKGYTRHTEIFAKRFKESQIIKARVHGKREAAAATFTEQTRMLPQEIHSYQMLERAIGPRTDRIALFQLYLEALPTDIHPATVENILIPLYEFAPESDVRDLTRGILQSFGYRFDPHIREWRQETADTVDD